MYCPKCGSELREGAAFCAKCGTPIKKNGQEPQEEDVDMSGQQTAEETESSDTPGTVKKKTSGPLAMIILIILFVLFLICVTVFSYYYFANRGLPQKNSAADVAATQKDISVDSNTGKETAWAANEQQAERTQEQTQQQTQQQTEALPQKQPITCSILYSNQIDLNAMDRIPVQEGQVTQSSYLVQNDAAIDNRGWKAFDGDSITSWQVRSDGMGVGESLTAYFDKEYRVKALSLQLGNHRSDKWYIENNRPKKLQIILGQQSFEAAFPDVMQEFAVEFSEPVPASSIQIVIADVYAGSTYNDTAISEIGVYEE